MTVQLALRVVSLESRRGPEMASLLTRHGLVPIEAPSMREVPLEDQREALRFGEALVAGECDYLVLLTGVGLRTLITALSRRWPAEQLIDAFRATQLVCRGPKPVAVLKELGLRPALLAPEPNTWRELLAILETHDLDGKRVWVQEYGRINEPLLSALRARRADVQSAAVYAWRLPEDVEPLRRAVRLLCSGEADAILFTSAQQLEHLNQVATELGLAPALRDALNGRVLVGSIGPVTSEALREAGLAPDLEPPHSKMGHLVKAIASAGLAQLEAKRASRSSTR